MKEKKEAHHKDGQILLPRQNETGLSTSVERNFFLSKFYEEEDKKTFTNLTTVPYEDISEYEELSRDTVNTYIIIPMQPIILHEIETDSNKSRYYSELNIYFQNMFYYAFYFQRFEIFNKSSPSQQNNQLSPSLASNKSSISCTSSSSFRPRSPESSCSSDQVSKTSRSSSNSCRSSVQYNNSTSQSIHDSTEFSNIKNKKKRLQKKRNHGLSYDNASGKQVPKRKIIPLQPCRKNCKNKFEIDLLESIHTKYWSLGTYDLRVAFLFNCIKRVETKTTFKRKSSRTQYKDRQYSYLYFFELGGSDVNICQLCFKKVLNETNAFIYAVIKKKYANETINLMKLDQRGRRTPQNKTDEHRIKNVKNHILSFPAYESHYSRKQTNKKYLPAHLNVNEMYRLYKIEHPLPVSISIYRRTFNEMGLKFKPPYKDTCSTCDLLKIKISSSVGEE